MVVLVDETVDSSVCYTNAISVSAVCDLYGAAIDEGAKQTRAYW